MFSLLIPTTMCEVDDIRHGTGEEVKAKLRMRRHLARDYRAGVLRAYIVIRWPVSRVLFF